MQSDAVTVCRLNTTNQITIDKIFDQYRNINIFFRTVLVNQISFISEGHDPLL